MFEIDKIKKKKKYLSLRCVYTGEKSMCRFKKTQGLTGIERVVIRKSCEDHQSVVNKE